MITLWELQPLLSNGIISQEQLDRILDFQWKSKESWSGFPQTVVTIGSILIGLWILSLVALNRDGMTDLLKIGVMILWIIVSYLLGWYFKSKQKPILWWSLLFLSGLFVGTTIFLIAQIYNLTVTNDILLGLRIIMILPLVYLLRQKEFYYLYIILLSCVLWQFLMSHVFQVVDERNVFVLYILFGFVMMLWGYIHESYYDDPLLAKLYKIFWSNIAMISYFIIITINYDNKVYTFLPSITWIIIGILWITLLYYYWKKQKELLLVLWSLFLIMMGILFSHIALLNYSIFIVLCLVLVYLGSINHNNGVIKMANAYLYIFLLYLYGRYGREYENKAIFFIVGGLLTIGLGLGFSRLSKTLSHLFSHSHDVK